MAKKKHRRNARRILPLLLVFVVLVGAAAAGAWMLPGLLFPTETAPPTQTTTPTTLPPATTEPIPTETTLPPAPHVVSTASISAQGDLLIHKPIITMASEGGGKYDFSDIYKYLTDRLEEYDYSIANLETTLGGSDIPYRGYPSFNCPDEIAADSKAAGYDMLLTANNHSYDTSMSGVNRTLQQVREAGLTTLGTRLSEEEPRYSVVDINGIQVGMVCYTVSLGQSESGGPRLNSGAVVKYPEQVNYFFNHELDAFYQEIEGVYGDMMADGAEASMIFLHWGYEYKTTENETQREIAQKMCDLGFDVIVGGHPHVVQPMDLLTSNEDPDHKAVCIYSLGNAVSNQRREHMNLKTGHTEDGVFFTVEFEKYSDGAVYLADADVIPTWVKLTGSGSSRVYSILPLDIRFQDQWESGFDLSSSGLRKAQESYERTTDIVGEGLAEVQEYLRQQKSLRDGS